MTTYEEWKSKATSDLKGADFDRRLRTRLLDGTTIEPIYSDAPAGTALPRARAGFDVGTIVPLSADAAALLADDVQGGTDAVLLSAITGQSPDIERIRELAAAAGGAISTGFMGPPEVALSLATSAPCPVTRPGVDLAQLPAAERQSAFEQALAASAQSGVRALVIDGGSPYEAGSTELHALAYCVSATWQLLRWSDDPAKVFASVAFRLRAGRDYVRTVAMFRALRLLLARLQEAAGAPIEAIDVEAISSRRDFTMLDRWSNMIRGTVGACAAIAGGADRVFVLPMDEPIAAAPSAQARRSARNALLVAAHESHMGWVHDPAAGAWAFETLTSELCAGAWALAGELDAAGGVLSAEGEALLSSQVADVASARSAGIANRSFPIVGSSEYPNGADLLDAGGPALAAPGSTDDAVWHALRVRGQALTAGAALVLLDDASTMRARMGWVEDLLACAGIRVTAVDRQDAATIEHPVVVFCGPDASWADLPAWLTERAAGLSGRRLVLAGRPADQAPLVAAGVDEFVFAGADLLGALSRIVSHIEEVAR